MPVFQECVRWKEGSCRAAEKLGWMAHGAAVPSSTGSPVREGVIRVGLLR